LMSTALLSVLISGVVHDDVPKLAGRNRQKVLAVV